MPVPISIIETRGVRKCYGETVAVEGLDLAVHAGEILGFLGPNGAGKTTTIKMLVGLVFPASGTALIDGHDVHRDPIRAKRRLGYVPDHPSLPDRLTAHDLLEMVAGLQRLEPAAAAARAAHLLALFGLDAWADRLIGGYSLGMRQKIALAAALMHEPAALVLDEPLVGLDPPAVRLIKDLLRSLARRGAAILISTHLLEVAERLCDRVVILDRGRLVAAGTFEALRAGHADESLEDVFLRLTGETERPDSPAAASAGVA